MPVVACTQSLLTFPPHLLQVWSFHWRYDRDPVPAQQVMSWPFAVAVVLNIKCGKHCQRQQASKHEEFAQKFSRDGLT